MKKNGLIKNHSFTLHSDQQKIRDLPQLPTSDPDFQPNRDDLNGKFNISTAAGVLEPTIARRFGLALVALLALVRRPDREEELSAPPLVSLTLGTMLDDLFGCLDRG